MTVVDFPREPHESAEDFERRKAEMLERIRSGAQHDYADEPQSLTERRGLQTGNAAVWTPRDVLIQALRDLDSGKMRADALIVSVLEKHSVKTGVQNTFYYASSPSLTTAVGLLRLTEQELLDNRKEAPPK